MDRLPHRQRPARRHHQGRRLPDDLGQLGITDPHSPNFYDETIRKTLRISGAGEFVHLADWNIPQHGKANTSHGCINVAPAYIYWFYNTFGAGDIVDVRNTGRQLNVRDGLGDWVMPWDQWVKGSAFS